MTELATTVTTSEGSASADTSIDTGATNVPSDIPSNDPVQTPTEPQGSNFSIPDEFKNSKHLAGLDSWEAVQQKIEGLDLLRGKKGLPEQNTPEAWAEFVGKLGEDHKNVLAEQFADKFERKAPENYDFEDLSIEGYTEDKNETQKLADIGKKLNLSQDEVNTLRTELVDNYMKETAKQQAELSDNFSNMANKEWGPNWESEIAPAAAKFKEMYADYLGTMENVDNSLLVPMLKHIDTMMKSSGADSSIPGFSQQGQGMSGSDLIKKHNDLANAAMSGKPSAVQELNNFNTVNREALSKAYKGK